MRLILLAACSLNVLLLQAQFADIDPLDAIIAAERNRPLLSPERSGDATARGFDVTYARCEWQLDPAVRYIQGSVTTYFRAATDLSTVVLDLSEALVVTAVSMHGTAVPFNHGPQDLLTIDLPTPLANGQLDSVTVTYHGEPPNTGFGSFDTIVHAGAPVVWTLSQPYGAKDWWPCKQDLNDKIDSLDCLISVPLGNRAACNGLLLGGDTVGNEVTWHWRHRYPIDAYLVGVAVTDYMVNEQYVQLQEDSLLMLTYAYPDHYDDAVAAATNLLPVISLYDQLFGTYPFIREKYGHAEFSWSGGMEHQTMSFMGTYHPEIAAHELGHQWFGDKVTCASWAEVWLNEGFATYLSGLYYEHLSPEYWPIWKKQKVAHITNLPDGSVFCTDTTSINRLFNSRLTYNKAAMVIHMLRWICGDSAFYAGLRNYLNDPALAYATATTADLQSHLEASSGLDLNQFMADWYTGEGYPSYTVVWGQDQQGVVTVQLSQATSHPSVDFFALPVPLQFIGSAGDTTVVLENTSNGQLYYFTLPFTVDSVAFDPDTWLISAHNFVTGVDGPVSGGRQLLLHPNPVHDRLFWQQPWPAARGQVHVVDMNSRVVLAGNPGQTGLDVSSLARGVYMLELRGTGGVVRGRFIKE